MLKRIMKEVLAIVLALSICLVTINIEVFAETNEINSQIEQGTAVSISDTKNIAKWDGVTTESVYEEDNYRITFKLTGYWEGGYNASIRINNLSDSVIES